jgi:hypothetical protein
MQLTKPYFKKTLTQERIQELRSEFSSLKSLPNKTNKQWQRMATIGKKPNILNYNLVNSPAAP